MERDFINDAKWTFVLEGTRESTQWTANNHEHW